jgi:hypothetical protein
MPVLVFVLLGCSSKREVFIRSVDNSSHSPGIKLMYSYNGYQWQEVDSVLNVPVVGEGSVQSPSFSKDRKGVYHAVWVTVYKGKEGLVHTTTEDFKIWSLPVFIRVVEADSTPIRLSTPRLFFNEQSDSCMMYWSSERMGSNAVYGLKTLDFKQFTSVQKLYDPGLAIQDPCLLGRSPSDYVLIFTDADPIESNLKVAFSNKLEGPYERLSPSISAFQTGNPSVSKIGAKWYIFFEATEKKQINVVTTLDFGSFESITEETTIPYHPASGDIIKLPRKPFKKLLRYLHCKPVKEKK